MYENIELGKRGYIKVMKNSEIYYPHSFDVGEFRHGEDR